jgi:hypothetical protein
MLIPLATVCQVTGAARSTIYHRRSRGETGDARRGPRTAHSMGTRSTRYVSCGWLVRHCSANSLGVSMPRPEWGR